MKQTRWTIYYRTGGKERFQWHRLLDTFDDRISARKVVIRIEKMGYPAYFAKLLNVPEEKG